ncbi:MAG TPA: hypothetical protein VHS34_20275 [Terriglobales bacterium]|jgi:hypothetical protein|nr:hypothetical protein [Terriglobales bacterium]
MALKRALRPPSIREITASLMADPLAKKAIEKLAASGVPKEKLVKLLILVPGASTIPPLVAGIPDRALRRLPDRIQAFANTIERVNESLYVAPDVRLLGSLFTSMTPEQKALIAKLFPMTPQILRWYAGDLRDMLWRLYPPKRPGQRGVVSKKINFQRLVTIRLVRLVKDSTGKPRYGEVATLLEAAYRIAGTPRTIADDNVRKLDENNPRLRSISKLLLPLTD